MSDNILSIEKKYKQMRDEKKKDVYECIANRDKGFHYLAKNKPVTIKILLLGLLQDLHRNIKRVILNGTSRDFDRLH